MQIQRVSVTTKQTRPSVMDKGTMRHMKRIYKEIRFCPPPKKKGINIPFYHEWTFSLISFYRCTVHSDIHTVHSSTDAHLLKFWLKFLINVHRPPLWSSGQSFWLQIQRSRVRFPALPDFLSSSGSGTGSTQPRQVNGGTTWIKK